MIRASLLLCVVLRASLCTSDSPERCCVETGLVGCVEVACTPDKADESSP